MREDGPPRFAQGLIRLFSRSEERPALLGDLEETFTALAATRGHEHASRWYWRETITIMMFSSIRAIEKDAVVAGGLGVVGGAVLIATTTMPMGPWWLFFVYAALMITIAIFVRVRGIATFSRRFVLSLTTFMTMTFVLYAFVLYEFVTPAEIPFWGYVWSIALMLAFGFITAAIVAGFSGARSAPFLIFPCVPIIVVAALKAMPDAQALRTLAHGVMPFTFFVNWRRDGWGWGFAGLDILLWAAVGWLLFRAYRYYTGNPVLQSK